MLLSLAPLVAAFSPFAHVPISSAAFTPLVTYRSAPTHGNGRTAYMTAEDANLDPPLQVWVQQGCLMWVAAAILGPVCDGRHSSHDVLHYAADSIAGPPLLFSAPGSTTVLLETCWWVPIAFGGAGVILGAAHPALDRLWDGKTRAPPGWPTVLIAVAAFVACYDLSGQLAEAAVTVGGAHNWLALDAPLAVCTVATFLLFERSRGGLFMMLLLAIIGPVAEIGLINGLHLYSYTHPDVAGIPSWITWVYAAGGPANGALGRQLLHELTLNANVTE